MQLIGIDNIFVLNSLIIRANINAEKIKGLMQKINLIILTFLRSKLGLDQISLALRLRCLTLFELENM